MAKDNLARSDEGEQQQSGNRPVDKVRIGNISASIWRNSGEKGDFYTVTLERSYKDGENWKSTHTLGRDDLLEAAKVLDRAHDKIVELQQGRARS
jgi:hypothetical protein